MLSPLYPTYTQGRKESSYCLRQRYNYLHKTLFMYSLTMLLKG